MDCVTITWSWRSLPNRSTGKGQSSLYTSGALVASRMRISTITYHLLNINKALNFWSEIMWYFNCYLSPTERNKQINKMTASANGPSWLGRTSMLTSAALIFLQILAIVVADPTGTQCNPPEGRYETCVCQASNGVVDLTGLSNDDGESARYACMVGPSLICFLFCLLFYSAILKNLSCYSPQCTNYSLSETNYSH